MYLDAGFIRIY